MLHGQLPFRVLVLAALMFCCEWAGAGELHPILQTRLRALDNADKINTLVFLTEQADVRSLHEHHLATGATRDRMHREVVRLLQETAARSQAPLIAYLESRKSTGAVEGYVSYWITNMIAVRCTKAELLKLARRDDVAEVWENFQVEPIAPVESRPRRSTLDSNLVTPGLRAIRADCVWHELGITGAGRLVGNLDTGVKYSHPALTSRWRGNHAPWSECWQDLWGHAPLPVDNDSSGDSHGHGTHTMGTICGLDTATADTIGVAWRAEWIASTGIYAYPEDLESRVTQAFQWFADPDGNPNTLEDVPDVVSNSWGVSSDYAEGFLDCDARWNEVIYNTEAAGVVVVFAAGNSGPNSQTLGSPGNVADNDYFCFAVGAVDATHSSWPYPITWWSSRGPSDCNEAIKPEIAAPGLDVYSSLAGHARVYGNLSGTSMACPHVAGTIALMREADPDLPVEVAKEILMRTARDLGQPGEDNDCGHGMLDAYAAVTQVLRGWGTVSGIVRSEDAIPLDATITLADQRQFRTDSQGHFRIYLPGDSVYSLNVASWGYVTIDTMLLVPARGVVAPQYAMTLHPRGVIAGVVLDEQYRPLPGAELRVLNTPLDSTVTDAQGRFAISLPPSAVYGPYALQVSFTGLVDTVVDLLVVPHDTLEIEIRIVPPAHLPMGPDGYGYMAYDRGDSEDPAEYDWIEIEPDSGGPGTRLNFTLNDQTLTVNLPFSFGYYGQTYEQISVCCNGWIAMGVTTATDYRNWPIPDANGPAAMIAPFWEDFDPRLGGRISHYHDAGRGGFIVEFNRLAQAYPPDTYETFQVLLYNPQVYPTRTGDGNIVFQYKAVSDPSGCTVGIENPAETTGLQYLLDESYDLHATPLSDRAVIRFTTGYAPTTGGITGHVTLIPALPVADALITVSTRHIRTNGRGEFTLRGIPAGVHTVEAVRSGYERGQIENVTVYADSMVAGLEYWLYRLDPPFALQAALLSDSLVQLHWHSPFPLLASGAPRSDATHPSRTKAAAALQQLATEKAPRDRSRGTLDEVTGFRVYRNGSAVADDVADTVFVDAPTVSGHYEYWVVAEYTGGESDTSCHAHIDYTSAVEPQAETAIPGDFALYQNYPNPFNPNTEIRFDLPEAVRVQIKIFNIRGQEVATLIDETRPAGAYRVIWDSKSASGTQVASGVYVYRIKAGSFVDSKKMVLIR